MAISDSRKRILVLDADQGAALAIARSLSANRYIVDMAGTDTKPIAAYSTAVFRYYQYPNSLEREQAFLLWLLEHLCSVKYDLVIPVTERTLLPLHRHRPAFSHVRIAMPAADGLDKVLDKTKTFLLAEELELSVPKSHYVTRLDQLETLAETLSYPIVIKPSLSVSGNDGIYNKNNVAYAITSKSFLQRCQAMLVHSPLIIQSYFHGVGTGIELLADSGKILYAFQHERLHEVPLTGGGSSFRKSVDINPILLDASRKLIMCLNWTGVAMVEFKWNREFKTYCLMEINGRFWGSLPLATAAGADFPRMLAELLIDRKIRKRPDYRRNIYCRHLAKDLMWHEMVLRQSSDEITKVPDMTSVLRDLAIIFSPRHYFDIQRMTDPIPGLIEVLGQGAKYLERVKGLLAEYRYAARQRVLWRNGTVREMVRAAKTLTFVCYGNINRSAVAAEILRQNAAFAPEKVIFSAGFHGTEQRPADPRMAHIAASFNLDLQRHRSSQMTANLLTNSDVIFVMEKAQHERLTALNPASENQIFLLGAGSTTGYDGYPEIPDPYNKSEHTYLQVFKQVREAVEKIASYIDDPESANSKVDTSFCINDKERLISPDHVLKTPLEVHHD